MNIDLKLTEEKIMDGLKDFQCATVERVFKLFKEGQRRVLVADEVGLGKTLIARGVIAKTARYHYEDLDDDLFKVVYICSNQNIANQNINKLKISEDTTVDGVTDTRLSMQHLKIFEQENDDDVKDRYIQLIPLTPATSFSMTSGQGSVQERALMFSVLRRVDRFIAYAQELEVLFTDLALSSWPWARTIYEKRVLDCDQKTHGKYTTSIIKAVKDYDAEGNLFNDLESLCLKIKANEGRRIKGVNHIIHKLRMMFAHISVDLLKPDLVIMDEFQRFKFLISADSSSETGILANRFLKENSIKVLLLSATPYKLYSTLEEINETQSDDHYSEFLQVMNFLFNNTKQQREFKEVWSNFSFSIREINFDYLTIVEAKRSAEKAMYQGVCRTERISAIKTGDFIDDKSVKKPINITEKDILSYMEAEKLLNSIAQGHSVPVDYIKSAPYIFSFMKQYKFKKQIEKYFHNNPEQIRMANKKNLWVDDKVIRRYGELNSNNARLERLKQVAFENKAEMLLWIPPSKPYYEPQGVFKNAKNFSKVLVFSAWEMVPRMISSLLSYEAERRTVGKLVAQNKDKQNTHYFAPNNKRFPVARLRFNVVNENPQSMSIFCLLYPSKILAELFNPIDCINDGKTLRVIEKDLSDEIRIRLEELEVYQNDTNREDERWYYLAPMLLDYQEHVVNWLNCGGDLISEGTEEEEEKGQKGFNLHLNRLKEYFYNPFMAELGKMPRDLVEVLVKIAIASPAVCAYRANGKSSINATQLAKVMINQFNRPEATAVVELCYGRISDDAHWRNVLTYCRDGNLQALFDEYVHILMELNGLNDSENRYKMVHSLMMESMKTHSASYNVDTYNTFKNSVTLKKQKGIGLRSHYAVGFYRGEGDNSKVINRKESIRNSFNSPFRPFVLATTSIGQEGLDFHFYCRKILHWNLPSNPIDLEQREGRINRFKCLAIRQNIALKYGNKIKFEKDIWNELFESAKEEYKDEYSELIPFWCLPDDQEIKIERIVPSYPLSKDIGNYERLIKILSLYRLTLGQARQEELLEFIFKNCENSDDLKELFINLSPFYRDQRNSSVLLECDELENISNL